MVLINRTAPKELKSAMLGNTTEFNVVILTKLNSFRSFELPILPAISSNES